MKKIFRKFLFVFLILLFVFLPFVNNVKAGLYVPIACDSTGATCSSEATLEGYTTSWQNNFGGTSFLSAPLGTTSTAGGQPVSTLFAAIQSFMQKFGGNTMARSFLSSTIMPELMKSVVGNMLGTGGANGGANKAGNIVQNWMDYTSNARIGGGQQFTKTYYTDPNYLNLPEPMRQILEKDLHTRYGESGKATPEYKDVAKYDYKDEKLSDSENPFEMSNSSDLLLLLQPQNNYLGAHILATDYQDLTAARTEQAGINEPMSNGGGFLNTKDSDGKVIPGSLAKDVYQQQIIQTINGAQNVKSWADAENFVLQMVGSAIQGYLEQKFNENTGKTPSNTTKHVFGNY